MKKRFALCLTVVFMLVFSGNVHAVDVSTDYAVETVENSVENFVDIVETVENYVEKEFSECAENNDYILQIDNNSGIIGLENKHTGYIWCSSPLDTESDESASEPIKNEILS